MAAMWGQWKRCSGMRRFACLAAAFALVAPLVCSAHLTHAQASGLLRKANSGNVRALSEIRTAARRGDPRAETVLGGMYSFGKVLPHDPGKADKWFRKVAEQGDGAAADALATDYYVGVGVARNIPKAVYWFRKAAKDGSPMAEFTLGSMYKKGRSIVKESSESAQVAAESRQAGFPRPSVHYSCPWPVTGLRSQVFGMLLQDP